MIIKTNTWKELPINDDPQNNQSSNDELKKKTKGDLAINLIDELEIEDALASIKSTVLPKMNDRIRSLKHTWTMYIKWILVDTGLREWEIMEEVLSDELKVIYVEKRRFEIYGREDTFFIIKFDLRWIKYTAVEISFGMRHKNIAEMELGKRLLLNWNQNLNRFPSIAFEKPFPNRWIVIQTQSQRDEGGNMRTNIPALDKLQKTDALRECAKLWARPMSIEENIVLAEIVSDALGEHYISSMGHRADSDVNWYRYRRRETEDIDRFLGMKFWQYKNIDRTTHVLRNLWVYKNKNNMLQAFVSGWDGPDGTCAGIFTLSLGRWLASYGKNVWFRCAL